jgi:Leucine-rich repeat (LRR) protein
MLAFDLILRGLKCKIKRSWIYFDEKCDLSTCTKSRDYNVLLTLYPYHQDNDSYLLLNLILNQIQISNRMNFFRTLCLTRDGTLVL